MNVLIIGGLFGTALLAVIGVVLLLAGERSDAAHAVSAVAPPAPAPAQAQPTISQPVATSQPFLTPDVAPQTTRVLGSSVPVSSAPIAAMPAPPEVPAPALLPQPFPLMNGQLHEFSSQLRTLQQESKQLEQRLSTLVTMIEQIEGAPTRHLLSESEEDVTSSR